MRRSAMPRRTIPVPCCAAIGSTHSCVARAACRCCFGSRPPMSMTRPFARPLLELAIRVSALRPRVIRLDAGYWGLKLIAWIHTALGARAVIPWNAKRQKRRDGLPPTWTAEELGKRTSIERFFGRVLVFFRLQRPPVFGWSAVEMRVALTYAAVWVIALAAWQAGRPDLIRSPRLVLAHVWEGVEW